MFFKTLEERPARFINVALFTTNTGEDVDNVTSLQMYLLGKLEHDLHPLEKIDNVLVFYSWVLARCLPCSPLYNKCICNKTVILSTCSPVLVVKSAILVKQAGLFSSVLKNIKEVKR